MFEIERIANDLQRVVAGQDPGCLDGRDAAHLAEIAAEGERLFGAARRLGAGELSVIQAAQVSAGATDEVEARRRAKRDRNLRTWNQGFATHASFSGPTEDVAKILGVLEPLTRTASTRLASGAGASPLTPTASMH